jgi:hypothetical protein
MPEEPNIKANAKKWRQGRNLLTGKNVGKSIHSLLDGTFLTKDRFRRALPFIVFMMILGVIYISNIFHVERTKRQIDDLEEQLRELRYEYISSRSKLMYESKPSEIAAKLKDTGIGETLDPPKKILVSREVKNN